MPPPSPPTRVLDAAPLPTVPASGVDEASPDPAPPCAVHAADGRYELWEEIGRGGLGRVSRAYDKRLKRVVAVKQLIEPRGRGEERFLQEASITARLEHPGIVPVYDLGQSIAGPFYAMKLVSGQSLSDVISLQPGLAERLGLLQHVVAACEALAYAHAHGVVHRDFKPQNILVGPYGETLVIDWGLAKRLRATAAQEMTQQDDAEDVQARADTLTVAGAVMGTAAYMSPEQARGEPVDARSDVYAMGAVLYHLLAGEPAYRGPDSRVVLQQLLAGPPPPLEARERGVPRDLLAIVAKAMAREPSDRYADANELVHDLKRFHTGQLVAAHRYSARERLARFVRRYRAALLVAGSALLVLIVLGALALGRIITAQEEARTRARIATERADALALVSARSLLEEDPDGALAVLRGLSPESRHWSAARIIAADALSRGMPIVLRGFSAVGSWGFRFDGIDASEDGRWLASADGDAVVLHDLAAGGGHQPPRRFALATPEAEPTPLSLVRFSPAGGKLVCAREDGRVQILDLASGDVIPLPPHAPGRVTVAFAPGGETFATGDVAGVARIWALAEPRAPVNVLDLHSAAVLALAWTPDGQMLISAGADHAVVLWSDEGRQALAGHEGWVWFVRVSPDGTRLATAGADDSVRLWSLEGGGQLLAVRREPNAPTVALTWSPDAQIVAYAGADETLRLWRPATGEVQRFAAGSDQLFSLDFAPNGRRIVTGATGGVVRIWELAGDLVQRGRVLPGPAGLGWARFLPDGRIVAARDDGAIDLWDPSDGPHRLAFDGEPGTIGAIAWAKDGTLAQAGDARIFIVTPDGVARLAGAHQAAVTALAFAADGSLLSAGHDRTTRRWDLTAATPTSTVLAEHDDAVFSLVLSPDGRRFASWSGRFSGAANIVSDDLALRVFTLGDASAPLILRTSVPAMALSFACGGRCLVAGGAKAAADLWDLASGEHVATLDGHRGGLTRMALSHDGRTLATGDAKGVVRLWRLPGELPYEPRLERALAHHTGDIWAIAFSPDDRFLASGSDDNTVVLWDLTRDAPARVLGRHRHSVVALAFAPDARTLASGGIDRVVRLWDVASGESRVLGGLVDEALAVAFSPDGARLASAGFNGSIRVWDDDLPHEPGALRLRLEHLERASQAVPQDGSDSASDDSASRPKRSSQR